MNPRRISALLALPSAFVLAACSSSTSGQGSPGGSTGPSGSGGSATSPTSGASGGGGGGGTATDAAGLGSIMQNAVAGITSAHISLEVNAAGQSITGSGDEKVSGGKLEAMDLTENLPGGVGSIEIIIVDGKTYAKLPAVLNKTGKPYVLITADSSDPTIQQLASTLNSSLSSASLGSVTAFVTAAKSVTPKGHESVDGVDTTHYSVVVDVSKLPADLPGKSELSASGLDTLPIELYIDSSGRPVQVTEDFTVQGQTVSTKIKVTNYNKPVTITAPPADQVGTS